MGIEKTPLPLEDFFKVLIYGYDIELKNRFLRIGCEYGGVTAEATKDLHRHDKGKSTMKSTMENDDESTMKNGGEGTTRLNATDTKIVNIIKEDGVVTIPAIAQRIGLTKDGVFKALKRLKASNRIRRVGPDKGGHWEVC